MREVKSLTILHLLRGSLVILILRLVQGDLVERELRTPNRRVPQEVEADLPLEDPHLGLERDPVLGVDGQADRG